MANEPGTAGAGDAGNGGSGGEVWTVRRLLEWTTGHLRSAGSESPRLDAEILLAEAMGCPRISLYTRFSEPASETVRATFRELVKRRAQQTPVAYLVGRREFFSLDFFVSSAVLIPRPDTEFLVMALLDEVRSRFPEPVVEPSLEPLEKPSDSTDTGPVAVVKKTNVSRKSVESAVPSFAILDVGTGSGILAICAAKYLPKATVTAVDLSADALDVARRNAEKHGVADRITFMESDLTAALPAAQRFDFVLSNPPYVTQLEWESLMPEVRDHEPRLALVGGEDGMAVYERLLLEIPLRLNPGGVCFLETSPMLAPTLESRIDATPGIRRIPTTHDLTRHPRVTGFRTENGE